MIEFSVDLETCIRCRLCAENCPSRAIVFKECPELPDETKCLQCGQCMAVCPTSSLSILGLEPRDDLTADYRPSPVRLQAMIKTRRSVRHYKDEDVEPAIIRDLLNTACYAPTGRNAREILYTVVSDRESMSAVRVETYKCLTEALEPPSPHVSDPRYAVFREMAGDFNETGYDRLFCRAPHLLIASASPKAATPHEDCVITLSYFELYAQSLGLGTLWNGYAHRAITKFAPGLAAFLGIPENHHIGYAMSFGWPAVAFQRGIKRGPAKVNVFGKKEI